MIYSNNMENIYIIDNHKVKILGRNTIRKYIAAICDKINIGHLDLDKITDNVYPKLKLKNTIQDVNEQIIACATEMVIDHYDYPYIATYILIDVLHRSTHSDYLDVANALRSNINNKGIIAPIISDSFYQFVKRHHSEITAALNYERDFEMTVFGYRTLEKAYLKKLINDKIIERPQHLWMRIAIGIHHHTGRIDKVIETYNLFSQGYCIHGSPTLYNCGTNYPQLSSCYLLGINDDMESIGDCIKNCLLISKFAGGIGINLTNLRVDGAYIHSTQGKASGMKVIKIYNELARYADQGGKRSGSIAIYIEPWHGDVFFFLNLKKNVGAETERARDIFLALTINDIFMERVASDSLWSLMCPSECPDLLNKYGTEFTDIYQQYERNGKYLRQVPARELWFRIMESHIETGVPYIIYKDSINYKSNQINIGVVNSSNLCVSGDTVILTDTGYQPIKTLKNRKVNVWNGHQFSETTVRQTGIDQKLLKIYFSNKATIKCTIYHKFLITRNGTDSIIKEAAELTVGDVLVGTTYPMITNPGVAEFLSSLARHIDRLGRVVINQDHMLVEIKGEKNEIRNIKSQLFQYGCYCSLSVLINEKGTEYLITIDEQNVALLIQLGLKTNIISLKVFTDDELMRQRFVKITNIVLLDTPADTYCFNEPIEHTGIFNGMLTMNCTEIVEVSSHDEYAVCNLASICLPKFVEKNDVTTFNYQHLYEVTRKVCYNLNNVIDINYYPIDHGKTSNLRHRPIGIGVQGLADVFMLFRTPFDSDLARDINKKIFETIYFGALTESMTLAREHGYYETYPGSPLSQGKFQFDLWGVQPSGLWDWEWLRSQILLYGVRNSLTTTCMPTATTSQIMGNNECIEPYTENIYNRTTLAGDYYVINKHLMKDLMKLNLWNDDMIDTIKYYEGSVQSIDGIPDDVKKIYRTVWEIPQMSLIEMSADRGPFIDQTQSLNIFISKANFSTLNTCLFYGWRLGLKTGMYYLRSKATSEANQFGIDIARIKKIEAKKCSLKSNGVCDVCSS